MDIKSEASGQNVDINEMCRLCLIKPSKLLDIFESSSNLSIPMRIMACAALEVQASDALPKKICSDCRFHLEKYYVFRKKCKVSDTKLRRHLRLINAGKKSKVFEPQSDDEDEDDEHADSMAFFEEFGTEEKEKKLLETEEREIEFEERIQNAIMERSEDQEKIINERVQTEMATKTEELKTKFDQRVKLTVERKLEQNKENVQELIEAALDAERDKIRKEEVERILSSTKKHMEVEMSKISVFKKKEILSEQESESSPSKPKSKKRKIEPETIVLNKFVQLTKQEQNCNEDETENYQSTMEEEYIETDGNSDIFTITVNEDDQNDDSIVVKAKSKKNPLAETVIPEEVEPEEEEELEYNDYQSDNSNKDDDPEDIESITKAVKATLSQQTGFDENSSYELKFTRKTSNLTQVEVIVEDGTTILMDIQTGSKKDEIDENGEIKAFKCVECPKAFSRRNQLQRHTSVHNPDGRGITCAICDKWFPSKSSMDRHMRIHTGEKPFKCDICGRAFIQKEILKRHLLVHTGEKNFVCTFPDCDKKFSQSDMLKQHVNRKHNSTEMMESHKCTLCDKTFSYASGLSRHFLIHTGRFYQCDICRKKFNDRSAMKRHVLALHGQKTTEEIERVEFFDESHDDNEIIG